jgi:hypothetical protein
MPKHIGWALLLESSLLGGEARAAFGDERAVEILNVQGKAEYRIDENAKWGEATNKQPLGDSKLRLMHVCGVLRCHAGNS